MPTIEETSFERRRLLRAFGVGTAAVAALPLTLGAKADSESGVEKRKPRYKESDHVKTYYRVNRYPG